MNFDQAVFTLSMLSAISSFVVFIWASREGHPALRRVYLVAGSLCVVYVVSYLVVLSGVLVPAEWSRFMRPVSLIFWWVGVQAPTMGSVLAHKGTRAGLAEFFGGRQHHV